LLADMPKDDYWQITSNLKGKGLYENGEILLDKDLPLFDYRFKQKIVKMRLEIKPLVKVTYQDETF